jgi:cell division protease FtsH
MHKLAGLVAGRVAEQTILDVVSTGALNDLERTSKTAYAMVAYYGMSPKVGNVSWFDASGQRDMLTKPFSEHTAELIDDEVRRIVDEAVALAQQIVEQERERIEALADLLLAKETIFTEDIESVLGVSAQQKAKNVEEVAPLAESESASVVE